MSKHAPPYPNAATDPFNQLPGMNRPTKTMTAETDLLALPEWRGDFMTESEFREEAQAYARANVEARTEALRAEVERLSALLGHAEHSLANIANAQYLRAERLADALRLFLKAGVGNSTDFDIQCDATREARAALEQEKGRG